MRTTNDHIPSWRRLNGTPNLNEDSLHIWFVSLRQSDAQAAKMYTLLSEDERERVQKFCIDRARKHYCISRGSLRTILGRYTDNNPSAVRFNYSEFGKPSIDSEHIQFNVSHSGDVALIGVTKKHEIGIDVELIRNVKNASSIVMRYFSPRERSHYQCVPATEKLLAFYNGWTRKEAFTKAVGQGLYFPLDSFDVSLIPGQPSQLLSVREPSFSSHHWRIDSFTPTAGYKAAIAVPSNITPTYDYWRWN